MDTSTPIFWSEPKIQMFWGQICFISKKILGYKIPTDVKLLCFCVLRENVSTKKEENKVLLTAGKRVIIKNWHKPETPDLEQWINIFKGSFALKFGVEQPVSFSLWNENNFVFVNKTQNRAVSGPFIKRDIYGAFVCSLFSLFSHSCWFRDIRVIEATLLSFTEPDFQGSFLS